MKSTKQTRHPHLYRRPSTGTHPAYLTVWFYSPLQNGGLFENTKATFKTNKQTNQKLNLFQTHTDTELQRQLQGSSPHSNLNLLGTTLKGSDPTHSTNSSFHCLKSKLKARFLKFFRCLIPIELKIQWELRHPNSSQN